jgi:selenocysteine-specific elongation factor
MRVIGTAGHVDHGKSTLIAALTGTHPDRLKEERAREMTIDLGFASLTLPNGETVGIVDVPGHRDFIENMLAGVGGIDAALFVVAADEGVMPQTREHLAILDILQVKSGIIVLTKTDLIGDEEWFELVESDIRQVISRTSLENAPLVRVSARTRSGLTELISTLSEVLSNSPERADYRRPRLPIDRIFTMPGFGTVVTGTLTDGKFHTGDEVEVLPMGLRGRIRGLQTHNQKEDEALPGSRTAINISGVNVEEIERGSVVALPGRYQTTRWLDVDFSLLPDVSAALKHSTEVKLFIGTAEVLGRVRLLGTDELAPGKRGWIQLELRDPVVALRGDHYILRRPSPGETLGGGLVIDPHPEGRHKRFSEGVIHHLEALARGTPEEVLQQAYQALGPAPLREAVAKARLEAEQATQAIQELVNAGELVLLEAGQATSSADILAVERTRWQSIQEKAIGFIHTFHQDNPLKRGIPREELKSRLKLQSRVFTALMHHLSNSGKIIEEKSLIAESNFLPLPSAEQNSRIKQVLRRFEQYPYSPPSVKEAQAEIGDELFNYLVDNGSLIQVSAEVVFRKEDFNKMVSGVRDWLQAHRTITVAEFRDMYQTSRKYALGLSEYLDQAGITSREGDARILKK